MCDALSSSQYSTPFNNKQSRLTIHEHRIIKLNCPPKMYNDVRDTLHPGNVSPFSSFSLRSAKRSASFRRSECPRRRPSR